MKFKKGDTIKLNPDAEVSLSYKEGSPPTKFIINSIWIVDAVEDLDDGMQSLNISTFEPEMGYNAGSFCSWIMNSDVKEKVDVFKLKSPND